MKAIRELHQTNSGALIANTMLQISSRVHNGIYSAPYVVSLLMVGRTPDGTSIVTNSDDNCLRTFIMYASLDEIWFPADRIIRKTVRSASR